jgi:hypothetical protein
LREKKRPSARKRSLSWWSNRAMLTLRRLMENKP